MLIPKRRMILNFINRFQLLFVETPAPHEIAKKLGVAEDGCSV